MTDIKIKNTIFHKGAFKSSFVYFKGFYHSFRVEKGSIIHSLSKDGVIWEDRNSSIIKEYDVNYLDVVSNTNYLIALVLERIIKRSRITLSVSRDSVNWVKIKNFYPNDFNMDKVIGVKVISENPFTIYVKGLNNNKLCECIININSELIEESLTQIPLE